jgi:CheY-like chemotaxis protein
VKAGRLLEVIEALLAGKPAPARQSSSSDLDGSRPSDATSGSALVVDDNELNRRVALEMVRRLGLTARAVESGAEAIEAVRGERFDYVLMDVQMPDMDGFEATRRLLEVAGAKKPRVIAMTANALPGDRERCIAAGMSDYVTKPVRPGALAAALKRDTTEPRTSDRSTITDVLDAQVLEDLRMLEETSGASLDRGPRRVVPRRCPRESRGSARRGCCRRPGYPPDDRSPPARKRGGRRSESNLRDGDRARDDGRVDTPGSDRVAHRSDREGDGEGDQRVRPAPRAH